MRSESKFYKALRDIFVGAKGGTEKGIDIPEILLNLLGKNIMKIPASYVKFEEGEKMDINDLDYNMIKPLYGGE